MIKAGAIGAVLAIIYVMGATLVSPLCTFCLTPLLGAGTGYLASWFDKPISAETSLSHGMIAGGIAGFGAMVGQMLAAFVHAVFYTHSEQLSTFLRNFGLTEFIIDDASAYMQSTIVVYSFCGLFNLALVTGLGAVGGLIWFQRRQSSALMTTST
jgi:hypothetical protein